MGIKIGCELVCIKTHTDEDCVIFKGEVGLIKSYAEPYVFIEHGTGDNLTVSRIAKQDLWDCWIEVP